MACIICHASMHSMHESETESNSPGPRQYKNGFSSHALNRLFSACDFAFQNRLEIME